jgi:alpha-amylase/alpha-mannosidase (GH57 family)
MHQPFYKDLWTGQYKLPWTRLHALKDYAGMVRMLEEFPRVHQTFNLVPSMVAQIEDYALGVASDPFLECAEIPAETLSPAQRTFMLRYFFQANVDHIIRRYPRYWELYQRRFELPQHASVQDLRDLQVFSQIAWFDEDLLARDEEVRGLVQKGRDFSLADQELMMRKQREALAQVLPVYREFAARGQIEIATTPFYHPILPLLCDSDIAAVSHPGVTLPPRFQYPGDAHEQLQRARSYMQEKLGVAPVGLWPSEGSVSDEALALAADCGFTWAASDNGVLSRSLGKVAGVDLTYQAYRWEREGRQMRLLFRDHYLSDLIGFEYSRMNASDAAGHFLQKIRDNVGGHDLLVPVVLDGENAWEWYDANGRPFLHELYRRISEDKLFVALTVSEALERYEKYPLQSVVPGSWINANFDIWIGAEEDNRAWQLLLEARRVYDQHAGAASEDGRRLAFEELLIAEGSDWCWWYGPEHGSDNRPEFDELYRDHLSNVYRALGLQPPDALARPILLEQPGELRTRPENRIHMTLDGEVTSSFEWMGAGHYRPDTRSGAMHGGGPVVRDLYYGSDGANLFVRLDGAAPAPHGDNTGGAYKIEFEGGPVAEARVVSGRIVEMETHLAGKRFRVLIARDGLPAAVLPAEGWLEVP